MFYKVKVVSIFLLGLYSTFTPSLGQNLLKKSVKLSPGKVSLEDALDELAKASQFKLSYSPNFVPTDSFVVKLLGQATVKQHLNSYIKKSFLLKENGGFLIILPNTKHKENNYEISGYIINRKTDERVANATVYEPNKYRSTLTDNTGFFALQVSSRNNLIPISISKKKFCRYSIVYSRK